MKKVAVRLPEVLFGSLKQLVDEGRYPNIAEAIRMAIRDLLKQEGLS